MAADSSQAMDVDVNDTQSHHDGQQSPRQPTICESEVSTLESNNNNNTIQSITSSTNQLDPEVGNVLAGRKETDRGKRSINRLSLSDDEKMDKVYESMDGLNGGLSVLKNVLEARKHSSTNDSSGNIVSSQELESLTCKGIEVAIECIEREKRSISVLCANTASKKQADLAHAKNTSDERNLNKHNKAIMKINSKLTPVDNLKQSITSLSSRLASSLGIGERASKSQKKKKSSTPEDIEMSEGDAQEGPPDLAVAASTEGITVGECILPPLESVDGQRIPYSPIQTVNILNTEKARHPGHQGTRHLAAVKQAMIKHSLIPIKSSRLNELLLDHNSNKRKAGMYWDQTGPPNLISMSDLKAAFLDQQQEHVARRWEKADTKKAIIASIHKSFNEKQLDLSSAKDPCAKTVTIYHSALLSDPDIVSRHGREKDDNREMNELPVRSMLSNVAGLLGCLANIGSVDEIPKACRFVEEYAKEGILQSREILAQTFGVSTDQVHFTHPALVINNDDMACMYSQQGGLEIDNSDPGVVLKSNVDGDLNRGYGVHCAADEQSKEAIRWC